MTGVQTCALPISGVIEHVINMGSVDDFVEVNPGEESFRIQTKKVQRLRYVPPSYRVVPEHVDGGKKTSTGKGKKVRRSLTAGYWMVIFENETQALRVDDAFHQKVDFGNPII